MLNRVILIGRLANDPELKYTPSGIPVAEFRVAVDRPMSAEARAQNQEKQTDFISIVAWRQSAEFAANYLHKGRLVAVEGRLQVREYVNQQDGQRRRIYEVVADNLKGLDRPNREGGEEGGGGEGGGGYAAPAAAAGGARNGGANPGGYERGGAAGGGGAAPAARPAGGGYASGGPARGGAGRGAAPQPASGGGDFDEDYGDLSDPFAE